MKKQLLSALLAGSIISSAAAETIIKHDALEYFVPDNRITLSAEIADEKGIEVTRAYFKSSDAMNYTFVSMDCKENVCNALIPAPSKETQAIDYLFLAKNTEGLVVKTQTYRVNINATAGKVPEWQSAKNDTAIGVKSELASTPQAITGFSDNILIDAVESGVKYGVVAGITSAAEAGTTAAAVGATSAGTTVAGSTAIMSTTAMVGIGAGVIAVGAVAGGGGGDEGGEPTTSPDTSLQGASGDPRVNLQWNNTADLDLRVTDPCGNRISFSRSNATCNGHTGELDVDTIPSSATNSQENITWESGGSTGSYRVSINDFSNRSNGSTPYTVTIFNGSATQTFTGSVSANGTTTVTSFTH